MFTRFGNSCLCIAYSTGPFDVYSSLCIHFRWKYHEVCLLCLGYVQLSVCEKLKTGEINESFTVFLRELLLSSCTAKGNLLVFDTFFCIHLYLHVENLQQDSKT